MREKKLKRTSVDCRDPCALWRLQPVLALQGTCSRERIGSSRKGQPMSSQGKIAYMNNWGGYYVSGDVPPRIHIENQNLKFWKTCSRALR